MIEAANAGPLYRMPYFQMFFRSTSCASIGALATMLDRTISYVRDKIGVFGLPVAQDPVAQLACAEAALALDEMKVSLYASLDRLFEYAERQALAPLSERIRYKVQSASIAERCASLGEKLFRVVGAGGLHDDLPFGDLLADLRAARQHFANQVELHGRRYGGLLLTGREPSDLVL